ncbi:MAG TPA: lantibiotic dehydratase [Candidatus Baltobacteraceae bacterium]|nr:lantibiotic dehydratase [Candidatus Baltobacteraceae bacterium]
MYRRIDAVLVRAAIHSNEMDLPAWPDVTESTGAHVEQWRDWLVQVWSRGSFAEAIELASPVLACQVRKVFDGHSFESRQIRRIIMSVARYVLRMTGRATPFGLFAGVMPAKFGNRLAVRWGENHSPIVRPDAEWLAAVITNLEACPQLLSRLSVVMNNLCFTRGSRLVAPIQQHIGSSGDSVTQSPPAEVSVRHTRAVEAVMRYACAPIGVSDLLKRLAADFPQTLEIAIDRMIAEMVRLRLLITCLRPPMTIINPLSYIVNRLDDINSDIIPQVGNQVHELRAIHEEISCHNSAGSRGTHQNLRVCLTERMRRMDANVKQPITADVRLDADIVLPEEVAREAEAAAEKLMRLTPHQSGIPVWDDYYAAFTERYGIGALVPVLEVVNQDTGLGFPASYRGSARNVFAPPLSDRDKRLLALAQKAAMSGSNEIVMDEKMISEFDAGNIWGRGGPLHTELFVQIHATDTSALERGDFELAVIGASRAPGTTTGRFLDLLDPIERDDVRRAYASLPTFRADALPLQVSCPPVYTRSESVARAPAILQRLVSVSEYRDSDNNVIPLGDLAVTADPNGLYLVSLMEKCPVEPTVLNAVEFRNFSHPLARFLCEITRGRMAAYMPFSWGAANSLPFLPRIRHGRTVLAPARWNLVASDLPDKGASWSQWNEGMADWRQRFRLPAAVYLGEADNLLRLNLDQDMHLALLRSHLDRRGNARIFEAPSPCKYGWLGGRAHEVVVPLASSVPPLKTPFSARIIQRQALSRDYGHLPGVSEWLFVKLYGHPDRQSDLLIQVPDLLSAWNSSLEWWYARYRDPEAHLRLRFRLPNAEAYGQVARSVGAWTENLRRLGLTGRMQFDTYYPEIGRYGSVAAMVAAESVFAADSAAAIAQITHTIRGDLYLQAVTAASLVNIAIALTGSATDGMRWLVDHIPNDSAPSLSRKVYAKAVHLADPNDHYAAMRVIPGGEQIVSAWMRRASALVAYRDLLSSADEISIDSVLISLLHMHCNRVVGIDSESERMCHRLARSVALGWTARNKEILR